MREVERRVMLSVLDRKWREHLYEMDYLQEGIGLRAMAQRDPLVEYQREGFALWTTMNEAVREESVGLLFHVDVQVDQPTEAAARRRAGARVADARCAWPVPRPRPPTAATGCRPHPRTTASPWVPGRGRATVAPRSPCRVSVSVGPAPGALHYTAPSETGGVDERDEGSPASGNGLTDDQLANTPKNAPCPCGSGKKFKMCHGRR